MSGNSNSGEGAEDGRRFRTSSSFFRGKSVGGLCKQKQEGSGLVSQSESRRQDLQTLWEAGRRSNGIGFVPQSSFFLQLEPSGQTSSGPGCSSLRCGLDAMGKSVLLPSIQPYPSGVEEDSGAEGSSLDTSTPMERGTVVHANSTGTTFFSRPSPDK